MILEKTIEDIICKYPDLIETGLKLLGRQITLYGRRIDILFEDRFKMKLLVELKAVPIKDEHIGQLLSYEGMLLSANDPTLRVMLIGTRVPPNIQKVLDHHGIAWKEISNSKLIEFIKAVGDNEFLGSLTKDDVDTEIKNKPSENRKRIGKQSHLSKLPRLNASTTFEELCDTIRYLSGSVPTNYMDLLLLENENKTLSEILTEWQNYKSKNQDFQSVSRIKAHIIYRENHDGWIFSRSGYDNDPIFKLTGLTQQTSDMSIYEQIKKVMEGKNGMVVTSGFVKSEVERKYGRNISSVIPSDFCYNRVNDGIDFRKDNRLFKYIGGNEYEYLGEGYPYTGKIYHKPHKSKEEIIVGEWINGEMKYPV